MILFDVLPHPAEGSTAGIIFGVAFFFVALASGAVAFTMLRKTVKMAIRMFIVAAVLIIAVIGGIALYLFMKPAPKPYPGPSRRSVNSIR